MLDATNWISVYGTSMSPNRPTRAADHGSRHLVRPAALAVLVTAESRCLGLPAKISLAWGGHTG
jgi:hypothetical protein